MQPALELVSAPPIVSRRSNAVVIVCLLSLLSFATVTFAQSEALTLPRNLTQLVDESQLIVQGRVASVTLAPHGQLANLLTVVVTLQVEETVKGPSASTYTFRQAVIDRRDQQQLMGYRVGQHLLLALIRPSTYDLSSPAGMLQGRFLITTQPGGKSVATNGLGNAGLLRGVGSQLQANGAQPTPQVRAMLAELKTGPLPLEDLKSLMRTISARNISK